MIRNIIIAALICLIAYPAMAGMKATVANIFGFSTSTSDASQKIKNDLGGGL